MDTMKGISLTPKYDTFETFHTFDLSTNSKKLASKKRVYNKRSSEKIRRWTEEECNLYEEFISKNLEVMKDSTIKRTEKIFLSMSQFIASKTPSQCRSHHQKFFKRVISQMGKNTTTNKTESQDSTGSGIKSHIEYNNDTFLQVEHEKHAFAFFSEEEHFQNCEDFQEIREWGEFSGIGRQKEENYHELSFLS